MLGNETNESKARCTSRDVVSPIMFLLVRSTMKIPVPARAGPAMFVAMHTSLLVHGNPRRPLSKIMHS